jgi:hypothetical protein
MDEHNRENDAGATSSVNSTPEGVEATDSGIGFIYSALESLAKRYRISDAAVVLVTESFGTQMFRLNGKAVSAALVDKFGSHPGVYCTPDIIPQSELDAVYAACQQSFSSQSVRFTSARTASSTQVEPEVETEVLEPSRQRSRQKTEASKTPTDRSARSLRSRTTLSRNFVTRALLSRLLILIDVATFIVTVGAFHGPVRIGLGLVLGLVIPGWCVVGLIKLDNPPLEFGLSLAVSLALLMIVAQILETINLWHLAALEEVICVISLPFLIYLSQGKVSDRMGRWVRNRASSVKGIQSHRREA